MFIKRTRDGSKDNPYYYIQLVHSYRDKKGYPRHKVIMTLGREDKINIDKLSTDIIKTLSKLTKSLIVFDKNKDSMKDVLLLGPIIAIESIWKKLNLDKIIDEVKKNYNISFNLPNATKLMVMNRLLDPKSKLSIMNWKKKIYSQDFDDIELQHLYRTLDILAENKDLLQKRLFETTQSLFKPKIRLVFYDLTTIYFESQMQDVLRRFGYSKDNKTDCVQVVLAFAVDENNIPICYEMFPGNTYEGHTVESLIKRLKEDFEIEKVVVVGDKGILSDKVLSDLEGAGLEYIVSAKLNQLPKKYHKDITDKSSYKDLGNGLLAKELEVKGRRLVLCYSEKRAQRDSAMREETLNRLSKKLKADPKSLTASPTYRRYLRIEKYKAFIDESKVEEQSKWDGFYGFYTNAVDLSPEKVVDAYHSLWQVEESFRCMKSTLDLRPVYHWTEKRIEGHVMMCFMSFYVLRVMQKFWSDYGLTLSPERAMELLSEVVVTEVKAGDKLYHIRTEIAGEVNQLLRSLGCKIPSTVLEENVVE